MGVWLKVGTTPPKRKRWRPPNSNRGRKLKSSESDYQKDLADLFDSGSQCGLEHLDAAVASVADRHGPSTSFAKQEDSKEVAELRTARKQATTKVERCELSKNLRKAMRRQRRQHYDTQLDMLIESGKASNLKSLVSKPVAKKRIAEIKDARGNLVTDQAGILNVFAVFYESLYCTSEEDKCNSCQAESRQITYEIWHDELQLQLEGLLRRMKTGKCCAEDGLVAEMLRPACEQLLDTVVSLFLDVLSWRAGPPEHWKVTCLIVSYKKGDASLPENYRPIMVLPVLCKLFSGVLLERMRKTLECQQTPEEMGFRRDYSCSALVHLLRMSGEKSKEWGETVWMASVDLEKAFDKVIHEAVLRGLEFSGADAASIAAVKRMYSEQYAYIDLGSGDKSRLFMIMRGVRQGDPLSPSLFANSIRICISKLKAKWEREGLGTSVGSNFREKTAFCTQCLRTTQL